VVIADMLRDLRLLLLTSHSDVSDDVARVTSTPTSKSAGRMSGNSYDPLTITN